MASFTLQSNGVSLAMAGDALTSISHGLRSASISTSYPYTSKLLHWGVISSSTHSNDLSTSSAMSCHSDSLLGGPRLPLPLASPLALALALVLALALALAFPLPSVLRMPLALSFRHSHPSERFVPPRAFSPSSSSTPPPSSPPVARLVPPGLVAVPWAPSVQPCLEGIWGGHRWWGGVVGWWGGGVVW